MWTAASIIRDNIPLLINHAFCMEFALRKDNLQKKTSLNMALAREEEVSISFFRKLPYPQLW